VKLPVAPSLLRARFPALSEDDLDAYVQMTQQVLADPANRGRRMAAILAEGRRAREKPRETLSPEESLALRYLIALEKMQG
jgi:hypothetical protein